MRNKARAKVVGRRLAVLLVGSCVLVDGRRQPARDAVLVPGVAAELHSRFEGTAVAHCTAGLCAGGTSCRDITPSADSEHPTLLHEIREGRGCLVPRDGQASVRKARFDFVR